jgi:hypothetical protein
MPLSGKYLVDNLQIPHDISGIELPNVVWSDDSDLFLRLLFTRMILSFEKWNQCKTNVMQSFVPCSIFTIPNYDFYPINIRDEISRITPVCYECKFNIGDRGIHLRVQADSENVYHAENFKETMCQHLFVWLNTLSYYAENACSQTLTIYLTLTNEKKIVPGIIDEPLDRKHVNCAFTFTCKDSGEIHIFRKEEWFKVFIHETFHSFGMDFSGKDHSHIEDTIMKTLNISPSISEIRIYEAYCETFAELIQIMFISLNSSQSIENPEKWITNLMKKTSLLLRNEQRFSMFQVVKILARDNIHYMQLITPSGVITGYKENTNVISYYIIKSALLFHMDTFLQWIARNNGFSICFAFQNNNIENLILEFCKITHKLYTKPEYVKQMNSMQEWMRGNISKPDYQTLFKTMRMSTFEYP